jgi:hypothetical protein
MTSASDFTEREMEVIRLLTGRFPDRALDARIVKVHRQEGGEAETLRLTLDDTVSTDFARDRVANASQSVEALTDEAEAELEAPGAKIGP